MNDPADAPREPTGSVEAPAPAPPRRTRRGAPEPSGARRALEWAGLIAVALVVALLLRTYVVQSFYIPSTSMAPTLQVGDRVLVNKLSYRFHDPHRGDIVVFRAPPHATDGSIKDLIKRIVGLPGETIEGRDGRIYINGTVLKEPWLPKDVQSRTFGPEKVDARSYWVLGDNRLDSKDSTFFKSVPRSLIIGRAFIRIWPFASFGFL